MNRFLRTCAPLAAAILSLAPAVATAATTSDARAETAPAAAPVEAKDTVAASDPKAQEGEAPAAEVAQAPAAEVKQEVKDESASTSSSDLPSRLKPGAVDEEELDESKLPISMAVSLGGSAGTGLVGPEISGSSPYTRQPSLGSSLTLRPAYRLPTFDVLPKMSLSATMEMGIEWMSASNGSAVGDRIIRLSDLGVGLSFPGLYKEDFTGISFSPGLSVRLPLSLASRFQNQFGSAGASLAIGWNSPEIPGGFGTFNLGYTPAARAYGYTRPSTTIRCGSPLPTFLPPTPTVDPIDGISTIPFDGAPRAEEYLEDGTCIFVGRQTLASVSNSANVSWTLEDHTVSASATHQIGFIRPLADNPELSSENAATGLQANLRDQLNANLTYTYTIPVDFIPSLSVSGGIAGAPGGYSMQGDIRIPFVDLFVPTQWNNNFTQAFISIDASI